MITLQVGVKVFLKNKDGKYLLLKRNPEKYNNTKGSWDIAGGRIDPGSSLIENLQREVDEETKLRIISNPRLIAAQDILHYKCTHVVRITYVAECEGNVVMDLSENMEFKWLTKEELMIQKDLDIFVKELVEDYLLAI